MAQQLSQSASIRLEGNKEYNLSKDDKLPSLVQLEHLHIALAYYEQAVDAATESDDVISSAKNAAVTAYTVASIMQNLTTVTWREVLPFYKSSLSYFTKILGCDPTSKSHGWSYDLFGRHSTCLEDFMAFGQTLSVSDRYEALSEVIPYVVRPRCMPQCGKHPPKNPSSLIELARIWARDLIELVTEALNQGDSGKALKLIEAETSPVMEYIIHNGDFDSQDIIKKTKEDIARQLAIAQAMKAIDEGMALLQKYEVSGCIPDLESSYAIITYLTEAIQLVKNLGEVEGIGTCIIGNLYEKCLGDETAAKAYYRRTVNIVENNLDVSYKQQDWYKLAKYKSERPKEQPASSQGTSDRGVTPISPARLMELLSVEDLDLIAAMSDTLKQKKE